MTTRRFVCRRCRRVYGKRFMVCGPSGVPTTVCLICDHHDRFQQAQWAADRLRRKERSA